MTLVCGGCPAFVRGMDWNVWRWNCQASAFAHRMLPSFMRRKSGDCVENGFLCVMNESASFSEHYTLFCVSEFISFQVLSSF